MRWLVMVLIAVLLVSFGFTNTNSRVSGSVSSKEGCSIQDSIPPEFGYSFTDTKRTIKTNDILFSVRGKNNKKTSNSVLKSAKDLADIIPAYPTQWITDYKNTEIVVSKNGEESSAKGNSSKLSKTQLELLQNTNEIDEVLILVNYESKNSVTEKMEPHQMQVSMDVEPQTNAQFMGGDAKLKAYLFENSSPELRKYIVERMQKLQNQKQPVYEVAWIQFSVNPTGQTDQFELGLSCGNHEMDTQLIELLKNMPKWKPAVNDHQIPVSQNFVMVAGQAGC